MKLDVITDVSQLLSDEIRSIEICSYSGSDKFLLDLEMSDGTHKYISHTNITLKKTDIISLDKRKKILFSFID